MSMRALDVAISGVFALFARFLGGAVIAMCGGVAIEMIGESRSYSWLMAGEWWVNGGAVAD